ncbi:ATP-dependent RNA helicase bel-like [Paramacrobiotus metropolitanus]|uniref:ATP-dependent RNA helicase bel-like n=1 Tax=Paramacrobiotus metropolitanus TaxID=2943436 RepID=UPI0024458E9C|nr:ATP-dependent RNA helicase bel-like [Paramacrobiotus metropolitanus]
MVAGGEYGQQQAMQQQPYNNNMAFGQRDMQHSGSTGSFNNFGNQNNNYGRNDGYGDRGGYGGYQPYAGHSARATVGISQNFAPEEENSPPTWADGLQRFQASLHWRSANNPDLVQEAASSQYSANPYILPAQAQMYQLPGAVDALQQRPFNSAAPDYTAGSADILVTSVGGYGQQQSMLQQPYNHNTAFGQRSMQHSGSTGSFNNFDGGASSASQHQGRNAQVEVFTLEEWNSPLPRDAGLEEMLFQKVNTGMDSGTAEVIVAETSGSNPPESIQSFNEIGLHDIIQQNLQLAGYNEPTSVQRHAIPILLSGRDLRAWAQKGSGKTTAFLIPIMSQILTGGPPQIHMTQQRQGVQYPLAVILAPSIELANQIHKESLKLAYRTRIRSVVLYGFPHERLAVENVELERVCHVIVATPGRLKCLLEEGRVSFHLVRYLVLEQVDFIVLKSRHEKSLREVMRLVGPKQPQRKTIMTLTADFKKLTELCEKFLHDFITVSGYAQTEGNFLLRFDINATASIKHQETRNCSDAHKVLAEFGISHRFTRVVVQPQFESGTSSEFPVKLFFVITVRSTQKELIDVQSQCRLHLNRNGIKWADITPLASSQQ